MMFGSVFQFFVPLINGINVIWLLCLIGAVVLFKKKQRAGVCVLLLIALVISLIGSRIPLYLVGALEAPYVRKSVADIPVADAVIMLGGSQEYSKNDLMGFNLTDASDRILTALEMVRQNKAPALVLSGGGDEPTKDQITEAQSLQNWIERWQLTNVPITNLGRSANTHEEAVKCAALMKEKGWKRIILVTSGFHMKRAVAVFESAGISVIPVACDFQRPGTPYRPQFDPFPLPQGFKWFDLYVHEKVGWAVYRLRGWITTDAAKKTDPLGSLATNAPAISAEPPVKTTP